MEEKKNLTYAPLDLHFPEDLSTRALQAAKRCRFRFLSTYRTCEMIPVFTPGGEVDRDRIRQSKQPLVWTPDFVEPNAIRELLERYLFPFMKPLPRVLILVTPPGGEVKVHVDCSFDRKDELQLKLRVVLSGDRTGLWFLSEERSHLFIDGKHASYILDGSHAHGMINRSSDYKYTLCLGSPWNGEQGKDFNELLSSSLKAFPDSVIWRSKIGRPVLPELFQEKLEPLIESGHPDFR